jgi:hypothetical protein
LCNSPKRDCRGVAELPYSLSAWDWENPENMMFCIGLIAIAT